MKPEAGNASANMELPLPTKQSPALPLGAFKPVALMVLSALPVADPKGVIAPITRAPMELARLRGTTRWGGLVRVMDTNQVYWPYTGV